MDQDDETSLLMYKSPYKYEPVLVGYSRKKLTNFTTGDQ